MVRDEDDFDKEYLEEKRSDMRGELDEGIYGKFTSKQKRYILGARDEGDMLERMESERQFNEEKERRFPTRPRSASRQSRRQEPERPMSFNFGSFGNMGGGWAKPHGIVPNFDFAFPKSHRAKPKRKNSTMGFNFEVPTFNFSFGNKKRRY